MIKEDNLEFSFSGLKSAFINLHHNAQQKGESLQYRLVSEFSGSCTRHSHGQDQKALKKYPVKTLVVAGGVAASKAFVNAWLLTSQMSRSSFRHCLCGDNAGMIAYASVSEWNKEIC